MTKDVIIDDIIDILGSKNDYGTTESINMELSKYFESFLNNYLRTSLSIDIDEFRMETQTNITNNSFTIVIFVDYTMNGLYCYTRNLKDFINQFINDGDLRSYKINTILS